MTVNGTYVLERNENLEGLLTAIGLKEDKVQKIASIKPTMILNLTSTSLEVVSKGAEEVKNTLTLGTASTYTLSSGFELEVNITFSGNTATGTLKKGAKTGEFTLDFTNSGVTETFNIGGNVAKRIYKRT